MITGWARATKIAAALAPAALFVLGALSIGCGPAPGYEPEPRMPVGYTPITEPATTEELSARAEAQQQQAEVAANGDIAVGTDNTEYADTDPSALTEFKPALEGHGAWVDDSTYGTVWVPSEAEVGTDFVPYTTAGHWTYADDTSWVWVSDYSWGWAPFHYGRWAHVNHHGWVWIPGRTYSGAYVVWRTGPGYDYVGWAPAGPEWYWYNGYAVGWTFGYTPYYSFCDHRHIYDHRLGTYVVRGPAAREHESHTRPYVAAAPSAGGAASGGGRVAASPTVGGVARTAATPTVGAGGSRTAATAHVGPRPTELGIRSDAVVAPPADHAGLARAHAFASPATAVAVGAAPPAGVIRRRIDHDAIATAPAPRGFDGRGPVSSRFDAAARSPQIQGVAPVPPRQSSSMVESSRGFSNGNGSLSAPSANAHVSPQQQPSFRSQPSFSQPAPTYRPAPSQPSAANPPSFRSSPSFSSPPPSFRSSPSVSSSPPSFRSSPSVSAAPSVRSSPSVSSTPFRSAAPSSPARSSAPSRSSGAAIRSKR